MKLVIVFLSLLLSVGVGSNPTRKFTTAVVELEKDYFTRQKSGIYSTGGNRLTLISVNSIYKVSSATVSDEIIFNAVVWEATLYNKKPVETNTYSEVIVKEFVFQSDQEAASAEENMKKYSDSLWRFKVMNNYFRKDHCMYLISTRAVMFEKDYKSITARLKKHLDL